MQRYEQGPTTKRSYQIQVNGDTVASAVWSISPAGPTLSGQTTAVNSATAFVSGVTPGQQYILSCVLTLASGQIIGPPDTNAMIIGVGAK